MKVVGINWSHIKFILSGALAISTLANAFSQSSNGPTLFQNNSRLPIVLDVDLDSIQAAVSQVKKGKIYLDQLPSTKGSISYFNDLGEEVKYSIKVKARGASRLHYCPVPMLKLNFDRDTTANDPVLNNINNMKVVIPCPQFELEKDDEQAHRWVAREKVLYEIYEKLSPDHYKTRMLQLTLLNKGRQVTINYRQNGKQKNFTFSNVDAFFIEPDGLVEDRRDDIKELDIGESKWSYTKIDKSSWNTLALYNYAVGNGDLDVEKEVRNVKLFVNKNSVRYVDVLSESGKMKKEIDINSVRTAIPFLYDLDYSEEGVHFAGPFNPQKRSTIKGPLYTEFHCQSTTSDLSSVARLFLEKKQEVLNTIETSTWINRDEKDFMSKQVFTPFFEYISSPSNVDKIVKKYSADC